SLKWEGMAIPILRAVMISHAHSQPLIQYSLSSIDETVKRKKRVVLCSSSSSHSSELNPLIRSEVSFSFGTCLIPHPKKVEKGGEDAFFVSNYNGGVIAVADGVSGYACYFLTLWFLSSGRLGRATVFRLGVCPGVGNTSVSDTNTDAYVSVSVSVSMLHSWAEEDVDPSLFPRELMTNAYNFVKDEEVNNDPQILIKKAHAATFSTGSATVIIAMLEKNGNLKIANVGDCGLRVIRNGQVIFSTTPQEHYFDCPYQLCSARVGQTYLDAM
ncbi:putative protein phosphatase 2C 26-like protein, partial [Trifolium pratense]